MTPSSATPSPRQRFRQLGREVMVQRGSLALHRARIRVGLALPGAEPLQGALADLLFDCHARSSLDKQAALDLAQGRLPEHTLAAFGPHVQGLRLPACSRLATRWSVLVSTSMDIPLRTLRNSSDDSRQLAQAAAQAWQVGDEATELAFLDHCLVCHDTLAFMLARRLMLRQQGVLPPRWAAVCTQLQQAA
jgi:hypothetical protein